MRAEEYHKKITCALITTNQIDAGIRSLSGLIKGERLSNPILFNLSTGVNVFHNVYPLTVKNSVSENIKKQGCNFVCFSVVDLFMSRTVDLIEHLKSETGLPIILGGIHAELYPEETLGIAGVDAICYGEAYSSFISVLRYWDSRFEKTMNDFWFKMENGSIKKNGLTPFYHKTDYSDVPLPDFSYLNYYLLDGEHVRNLSETPEAGPFKVDQHQIGHDGSVIYNSMAGCSNKCSFCNVTAQVDVRKSMFSSVKQIRQKPLLMVEQELKLITKSNKNMKFLCIMENDFACRSNQQIKNYCEVILKTCHVPFYTMVSPNTLNEEKLKFMIEGGLKEINMGVESNGEYNTANFNRYIDDETVINAVTIINKYKNQVYPFYDFINFNPEESIESILKTLALIRNFPRPFDIVIHHLTLGNELSFYKRLINDKVVVGDEVEQTNDSDYHNFNYNDYREWDTLYYNLVLEWIAGPHNSTMTGRLPIAIDTLIGSNFGKILSGILHKFGGIQKYAKPDDNVMTLLTRPDVSELLNNSVNRDILKQLNDSLPEIEYTNQK